MVELDNGSPGVNSEETTAFGITETCSGRSEALRTVFSLDVCETQMTWLISDNVNFNSLFVSIEEISSKPNKEWSVKMVFIPIVFECIIASCDKEENA
jgi:hypothetical protein